LWTSEQGDNSLITVEDFDNEGQNAV